MSKMKNFTNINIYTIINMIKTKLAMPALMLMTTIGLHAGYRISGTLEHTAGSSSTDAAFTGALKGEKSSIKIVSKTTKDTNMIDEWYQDKDQVLHAKLFMKPDTPPDYHGYAYEKDVFGLGEPFGQLVYVYIQGFLRGDTRNCQKVLSEFASFQVNQELIRITRVEWIEREDGAVNGAIVYAISPIVNNGKREFVAGNLTASRDAASGSRAHPKSLKFSILSVAGDPRMQSIDEEYVLTVQEFNAGDVQLAEPELPPDRSVTIIDGRFDSDLRKAVVYDVTDGKWRSKSDPNVSKTVELASFRRDRQNPADQKTNNLPLVLWMAIILGAPAIWYAYWRAKAE